MLRIPHCLDIWLTYGGEVVSLMRQLRPTPQKWFLVLISVRGWVNPGHRLEGLGKLKKFSDLIGIETCSLPACSIMPHPTTLPNDNGILLIVMSLDMSSCFYLKQHSGFWPHLQVEPTQLGPVNRSSQYIWIRSSILNTENPWDMFSERSISLIQHFK
jgi:hypothetical protein